MIYSVDSDTITDPETEIGSIRSTDTDKLLIIQDNQQELDNSANFEKNFNFYDKQSYDLSLAPEEPIEDHFRSELKINKIGS